MYAYVVQFITQIVMFHLLHKSIVLSFTVETVLGYPNATHMQGYNHPLSLSLADRDGSYRENSGPSWAANIRFRASVASLLSGRFSIRKPGDKKPRRGPGISDKAGSHTHGFGGHL
jgi:hypothetical protein